jgi:large subunit ribosomal protein L18
MVKPSYVPVLRRRREGKTNYKKRKLLLLSKKPFAAIRITNKNTYVQISEARPEGDRVIVHASSIELRKLGWKGSGKNTPSAYLVGYLAGLKALKKGIKEAVTYLGLRRYVKGSRIAAAIKGLNDAGLKVPCDKETYPSNDRVRGKHIASYAKDLKKNDPNIYSARFSNIIKNGLKPEDYPIHFEEIKVKIKEVIR